jgi:hypothetical protein
MHTTRQTAVVIAILFLSSLLAATFPAIVPVYAAAIDEVEPNDDRESAQELTSIGFDHPVNAAIDLNDTDWYRFPTQAGRTYTIELFDVSSSLTAASDRRCTGSSYEKRRGLWIMVPSGSAAEDLRACDAQGGDNVHTSLVFTATSSDGYFGIYTHAHGVAGTYSVRVLPHHDQPGAGWDPETFEPNNRLENAYPIVPGYQNALTSSIVAQGVGYSAPYADVDWYRFPTQAGRTYTIELFDVSSSLTAASDRRCTGSSYEKRRGLWIMVPSGSAAEDLRACDAQGGDNVHTSLVFTATSSDGYFGIYTHAHGVAGTYSVRVLPHHDQPGAGWDPETFEPNNRLENAYPIVPGYQNALTSNIAAQNGGYSAPDADVDWYRFPTQAGRTYTIELFDVSSSLTIARDRRCTGSSYEKRRGLWIMLKATESSDDVRSCDTQGGDNVHTSLVFTAEHNGNAYFGVYTHAHGVAGAYSVRVLPSYSDPGARWNPATFEPNNRWQNAYGIGVGETYALTSTLETEYHPYSAPWADKDWYRFEAERGETYTIEVFDIDPILASERGNNCTRSSTRFRYGVWLTVHDQQGNERFEDCDNTGSENVATSVDFTAPTEGIYHFQVMPHANTVAGSYHVRVTAASGAETPPPPGGEDDYYALVLDEQGNPVEGAQIAIDGRIVTAPGGVPYTTDRSGILPLYDRVSPGQRLVAISPAIHSVSTERAEHPDGIAYSVHTTSMSWNNAGEPQLFTIGEPGPQQLVLLQGSPLVLFNLVVSLEWAASDAEIDEIGRAFRYASHYLFDVTDGQMAFGDVFIADNAQFWEDADVQIMANNTTRPHAYIRGITDADTSHVIRLGRAWNGRSGGQGPWDEPDGYRTIVHEFGHYALGLYDSYIAYQFGGANGIVGANEAACTQRDKNVADNDATNATIMDYQYTSSELAMQGVEGLWSDSCKQTAQWQFNRQSDWETLLDYYGDAQNPPRWIFTTPGDRGSVLAGPVWPVQFPDWPRISRRVSGQGGDVVRLRVLDSDGKPASGAIVALYRRNYHPMNQGLTDTTGQLEIYGARPDDRIRVAMLDGSAAGSIVIADQQTVDLTLQEVNSGTSSLQAFTGTPYLRVIPQSAPAAGQVTLLVQLNNFDNQIEPRVQMTIPGSAQIHDTPVSYSAAQGTHTGEISFSSSTGTGTLWAFGNDGNALIDRQSTYRLQQIQPDLPQEIFSDDGNLQLQLPAGSLPGSLQYMAVMPPGALPGSLPEGLRLVGDVYDITVSNAVTTFEYTALLRLHFDASQIDPAQARQLAIYRWDPNTKVWHRLTSTVDSDNLMVSAPVEDIGTYALLWAPSEAPPLSPGIWLPLLFME